VLAVRPSLLKLAAAAASMCLGAGALAAQSAVQTFTTRPSYMGALASGSQTVTSVNLKSPATTPTDLGVATLGASGACIASPSFGISGPAKFINFDNGACGDGTFTFTVMRPNITGFGFFLGQPASTPGGPATFDVTTTLDGAATGLAPATFTVGSGLADGFFGLMLDPGAMSSDARSILTVTVHTSDAARIAIRDVSFAVVAPEPSTLALLGGGLLTLGAVARRRRVLLARS